jgi:hypothetical protein
MKNACLKRPVFIVEPFHAYHQKKSVRFFPPPLSGTAKRLIGEGRAKMIRAADLDAHNIYHDSSDRAVAVVEDVYPAYRKSYEKLFSFLSSAMRTEAAEDAFKMVLCDSLAQFYSTNTMMHRIEGIFGRQRICFSPHMNVRTYLRNRELLSMSGKDFHEHPGISFSRQSLLRGGFENRKANLLMVLKLCAQVLACRILGKEDTRKYEKRRFSHGITIIGSRQLRDNQRSPNFMINGNAGESKVVYFPLVPLSEEQESRLKQFSGEVCHLPRKGKFFANFTEWKDLLLAGLSQPAGDSSEELFTAALVLFNYLAWKHVLAGISLKHFISHGDFGPPHVGRNIALNQAGAQTWFFTDSMNHGFNFQSTETKGRHPFWTYLNYDHFVTWTQALANYYKSHPGSFRQTHVVGCLWSEHIRSKKESRENSFLKGFITGKDAFIISCFDTTYTRNGFTSYSEGIEYAGHLNRLLKEVPNILLIFKEKKDRKIHEIFDPKDGPGLMNIYDTMKSNPRIYFCSNQVDSSEIISVSDMVVSFPFTSTTFEALCNNRPAIWHDAARAYGESLFGNIPGIVTHGYNELKSRVLEIIESTKKGENGYPANFDSPLLDPFMDGKAIERFHQLLNQSTRKDELCKS